MGSVGTILFASMFFGVGWSVKSWFREYHAKSKYPRMTRLLHDLILACLLTPPLIAIAFALLSNTPYFDPVARWAGLIK